MLTRERAGPGEGKRRGPAAPPRRGPGACPQPLPFPGTRRGRGAPYPSCSRASRAGGAARPTWCCAGPGEPPLSGAARCPAAPASERGPGAGGGGRCRGRLVGGYCLPQKHRSHGEGRWNLTTLSQETKLALLRCCCHRLRLRSGEETGAGAPQMLLLLLGDEPLT